MRQTIAYLVVFCTALPALGTNWHFGEELLPSGTDFSSPQWVKHLCTASGLEGRDVAASTTDSVARALYSPNMLWQSGQAYRVVVIAENAECDWMLVQIRQFSGTVHSFTWVNLADSTIGPTYEFPGITVHKRTVRYYGNGRTIVEVLIEGADDTDGAADDLVIYFANTPGNPWPIGEPMAIGDGIYLDHASVRPAEEIGDGYFFVVESSLQHAPSTYFYQGYPYDPADPGALYETVEFELHSDITSYRPFRVWAVCDKYRVEPGETAGEEWEYRYSSTEARIKPVGEYGPIAPQRSIHPAYTSRRKFTIDGEDRWGYWARSASVGNDAFSSAGTVHSYRYRQVNTRFDWFLHTSEQSPYEYYYVWEERVGQGHAFQGNYREPPNPPYPGQGFIYEWSPDLMPFISHVVVEVEQPLLDEWPIVIRETTQREMVDPDTQAVLDAEKFFAEFDKSSVDRSAETVGSLTADISGVRSEFYTGGQSGNLYSLSQAPAPAFAVALPLPNGGAMNLNLYPTPDQFSVPYSWADSWWGILEDLRLTVRTCILVVMYYKACRRVLGLLCGGKDEEVDDDGEDEQGE